MTIAWNPNDKSSSIQLSNNNLTVTQIGNSWASVRAINGKTNGKYYWEIILNKCNYAILRIGVANLNLSMSNALGHDNSISYNAGGTISFNNSNIMSKASYKTGDIIGIALDMDAGIICFYKNNQIQCNIDIKTTYPISGTLYPAISLDETGEGATSNFGNSAFVYTIPSGFVSYDLPNKFLIKQGTLYYSIKPEFYSDSNDSYDAPVLSELSIDKFDTYGIDDISSIHNTALNKLIDSKYNIALLK